MCLKLTTGWIKMSWKLYYISTKNLSSNFKIKHERPCFIPFPVTGMRVFSNDKLWSIFGNAMKCDEMLSQMLVAITYKKNDNL